VEFDDKEFDYTSLPETSPEDEPVFHYTKISTIPKIFPGKGNVKIRLSDIRFLNDPSESKLLQVLLSKNKKRLFEKVQSDQLPFLKAMITEMGKVETVHHIQLPCFFLLAFTKCEDSLVFWNQEYAGFDGVAIQFNGYELNKLNKQEGFQYKPVSYVRPDQLSETELEQILKEIEPYVSLGTKRTEGKSKTEMSISAAIMWMFFYEKYSCLYKHISWSHEQEKRLRRSIGVSLKELKRSNFLTWLSIFSNEEFKEYPKLIELIVPDNKILPCTHLNFEKNVVRKIILGPKVSYTEIEVIQNYLFRNEYENITVERSKAPVRYKR